MKKTTIIQILILVGAIIDVSLGVLSSLGLDEKVITIIRLIGLIAAVAVEHLTKDNIQTFAKTLKLK